MMERHIDGIGFYDEVPTFEELKALVRERAYYKWVAKGRPTGHEIVCWLAAERELFPYREEQGGYRIYFCDSTKTQGFMQQWPMLIVTPSGYRSYCPRAARKAG